MCHSRSSLLALGFCSLHFKWDEYIHIPSDVLGFLRAQSIEASPFVPRIVSREPYSSSSTSFIQRNRSGRRYI
ncbi:MAG: hypothetical protein LBF66_03630 [Holosporales bacterium]|nr:hypothetical protein [Holosporales bacterium]